MLNWALIVGILQKITKNKIKVFLVIFLKSVSHVLASNILTKFCHFKLFLAVLGRKRKRRGRGENGEEEKKTRREITKKGNGFSKNV